MGKALRLGGQIPAPILPFRDDGRIDERELRQHIRFLLESRALGGLAVNGHAGEVSLLSREERRFDLEVVIEEVRGRVPVIAGVVAESTRESIRYAADAREAGADALLVSPPNCFRGGAATSPNVPVAYFSAIAEEVDLPVVVFQFPITSGLSYPPEVLARLCEVEQVVAVKDGTGDLERYEDDLHAIRDVGRGTSVLSSCNTLLVPSFLVGADGALSGLGALAPNLIAEGFEAVQAGDLPAARRVNDRLFPLVRAIYRPPYSYWHARIKAALVMIGHLTRASVRTPLQPIPASEYPVIDEALRASSLLSPSSVQ